MTRALLNGGDISSFTRVYEKALGGSPIPVVSEFGLPQGLPSPASLMEHAGMESDALLSFGDMRQDGLGLGATSGHLEFLDRTGSGERVEDSIARFSPDVVAFDCSPSELGAGMLYAFSLPCALGLDIRSAIIHRGTVVPHFKGLFCSGDMLETAIIESWLKRIPFIPVGAPRLDTEMSADNDFASRYVASRIDDIVRGCSGIGPALSVLVVVDKVSREHVESLADSMLRGLHSESYVAPEPDRDLKGSVFVGDCVKNTDPDCGAEAQPVSTARRLFLDEFKKTVGLIHNKTLTVSEARSLLIEIVARARCHEDIVRGPSVRGTVAFDEVLDAFAQLHRKLTAGLVGKAAIATLSPRIAARHRGEEASLIGDIVKETLYGIRFSGGAEKANQRKSVEPGMNGNAEGGEGCSTQVSKTAMDTESFAIVPEVSPESTLEGSTRKADKAADDFWSAKMETLALINDFEEKLRAGEITKSEFEQQRATLMARLKTASQVQLRMSDKELATTVIEMMDAQDKQWAKGVSFARMHVYYHVKGTCEGANIGPVKQDYNALKRLIDSLQDQRVLTQRNEHSDLLLTGFALDVLLDYLTGADRSHPGSCSLLHFGEPSALDRSDQIRRYGAGDRFRDISMRHTLRQASRSGKVASALTKRDLRVFSREPRSPRADVALCIDASGSMGFNTGLAYARITAAGLARAAFHHGNRVGVVAFNDRGQTVLPLTGTDLDSVLNGIAGVSANGNTNIGDGLRSAREMLARSRGRQLKRIVLITDGQASAVSETAFARLQREKGRDLTEEAALLEARLAADAAIRTSVIHVAPEGEPTDPFVESIARAGGGRVRHVTGLADLKAMLGN